MSLIQLKVSEEQNKMIEDLKPIFKTKARTKVLLACLKKTHDFLITQKKQ